MIRSKLIIEDYVLGIDEFYQMVYDTFGGTLKQTEDKELYVTFDWAVKYIEQNTAEK